MALIHVKDILEGKVRKSSDALPDKPGKKGSKKLAKSHLRMHKQSQRKNRK